MDSFEFAGFRFPRKIPRLVPLDYCGAEGYAPAIARRDAARAAYEVRRKAGEFREGEEGAREVRRIDRMLPRFKVDTAYSSAPTPGAKESGFYLDSDFMPGLRWQWADEVEGAGIRHTGWHTNDHGDGGTVRGLVMRLPHGRGFLAGHALQGMGSAGTVERAIYEEERDAARIADRLAEIVAESEREYSRAFDAGREADEAADEARDARREAMTLIRDIRHARRNLAGEAGAAICARLRRDVADLIDRMQAARAKRDELRAEWRGHAGFVDAFGEG